MKKPVLIGHLRRLGIWTRLGRVRRVLIAPLCGGIHRVVTSLGPRSLPPNIVLKHTYDYKPIYVNPAEIGLMLKSGAWKKTHREHGLRNRLINWYRLGGGWKSVDRHLSRNFYGAFVVGGDWDAPARSMDILPVIVELFRDGTPRHETESYMRQVEKIESGDLAWSRARSIEELDASFRRLVAIFEDMEQNGYRTQADLGKNGSDEIRVCIDREGRLCVFGGGTHRLSMAKLLDLERVPVILKRVHEAWVSDWMARTGVADPLVAIEEGLASLEASVSPPDSMGIRP